MALGVPSSCSLPLLVASSFAEEHPRSLIGSFEPTGRVYASPVLYSSLQVRIDCLSPPLGLPLHMGSYCAPAGSNSSSSHSTSLTPSLSLTRLRTRSHSNPKLARKIGASGQRQRRSSTPGPLVISTFTSRFNGSGRQAWFMGGASAVHIGSPHGISPQIEIMSDSSQSVPLLLAAAASALLFSPVACYRTHLVPFTHFIPSLTVHPFSCRWTRFAPANHPSFFPSAPLRLDMAMTLPH